MGSVLWWERCEGPTEVSSAFLHATPTCKADRTLEGASHAFEAVLYQVALQFGGGIEGLAAQFAFVVQPFIWKGKRRQGKGEIQPILIDYCIQCSGTH